jgi:hypothetical protein
VHLDKHLALAHHLQVNTQNISAPGVPILYPAPAVPILWHARQTVPWQQEQPTATATGVACKLTKLQHHQGLLQQLARMHVLRCAKRQILSEAAAASHLDDLAHIGARLLQQLQLLTQQTHCTGNIWWCQVCCWEV